MAQEGNLFAKNVKRLIAKANRLFVEFDKANFERCVY